MCSLMLECRLVKDPDEWWKEPEEGYDAVFPAKIVAFYNEHGGSIRLGGTYNRLSNEQKAEGYRQALVTMRAFRERFPEHAEQLIYVLNWWCHGDNIEDTFRFPEELEARALEEGRNRPPSSPALAVQAASPDEVGPGRIVEKRERPPLVIAEEEGGR
jgi:hypothetical protein